MGQELSSHKDKIKVETSLVNNTNDTVQYIAV